MAFGIESECIGSLAIERLDRDRGRIAVGLRGDRPPVKRPASVHLPDAPPALAPRLGNGLVRGGEGDHRVGVDVELGIEQAGRWILCDKITCTRF